MTSNRKLNNNCELRVHDSEFFKNMTPWSRDKQFRVWFGFWHYFISASMKIFIIPTFWNAPIVHCQVLDWWNQGHPCTKITISQLLQTLHLPPNFSFIHFYLSWLLVWINLAPSNHKSVNIWLETSCLFQSNL